MAESADESVALARAWREVIHFWFETLQPADWWRKSTALDRRIEALFGGLHARACAAETFGWRQSALGRLAEVLVLDQFSRHLYRDQPQAYAQDGMALVLAQEAVSLGLARQLPPRQRGFLYMPFMHSESTLIQAQSLKLFAEPGLEAHWPSAQRHQAVIARFGRYPHRNAILGRDSTPEEEAFLQQPGARF